MKNFNLLQIIPSLNSGGVEQGTVDVANFIGTKDLGSFIVSNGGNMLRLLNRRKTSHFKLPVHSKNILAMPFIARKLNQIIKDNNDNTYRALLSRHYLFEMIVIDCFSRQHALSEKQSGVGMARRIGYDYCIRYAKKNSLFFSLDADTLIHKNYLLQIIQTYKTKKFT